VFYVDVGGYLSFHQTSFPLLELTNEYRGLWVWSLPDRLMLERYVNVFKSIPTFISYVGLV
jgi:hypothetical protein